MIMGALIPNVGVPRAKIETAEEMKTLLGNKIPVSS